MKEEKDEKEKKVEEEHKEKEKVDIKPSKPPVKLDLIGFGSFDVPL
ncbi:MAG: hypothetical protein ABRQ39_20370 [Candidatus Eremiobacterota bacterium]